MERKWDDIYAVQEGTILWCLKTPSAYGYRIYIRHDDGTTAMYGHLAQFFKKAGDRVKGGECIAQMGATGNCPSGKHLHINFFSSYAKSLTGADTSDPSFWIKLNNYPGNTKVSGGYGELYTGIDKYGKEYSYRHEGLDLSGNTSNLIKGWEDGPIDALYQDLKIQK